MVLIRQKQSNARKPLKQFSLLVNDALPPSLLVLVIPIKGSIAS
jgi:hypothetical protein